jgi:hypothetical protein
MSDGEHDGAWPALPYEPWQPTCDALHRWIQVAGKVRLARTPWLNHSWHVPLYVTARGLCTGPIAADGRIFEITFDFVRHACVVEVSDGAVRALPLQACTVAQFHAAFMGMLEGLDLATAIDPRPSEMADDVPFAEDTRPGAYDRDAVQRFWRALLQAQRVLGEFRTSFLGKSSPVHFFWGSFDLAVTRFSGRRAPLHPGGVPHLPDAVVREAYSHEVSSAGFWPGDARTPYAAFYSYAYPEPEGFRDWPLRPPAARFDRGLQEFLLPYDAVREAADPDATLLAFLTSTYEAAAERGGWDRAALECAPGRPGVVRPVA